jgi:hypothetical protein
LSQLRSEFEARRANLFARDRVPLSGVLAEIRAEKTRLCGAGLLAVPSILAAASAPSRYSALPLLPTPSGEGRPSGGAGRPRARPLCGYCQKPGHPESGPSNVSLFRTHQKHISIKYFT